MGADPFDSAVRAFLSAPSRRHALRFFAGLTFAGLLPIGPLSGGAKGAQKGKGKGKKKGRGKKKGCPNGKKRCGDTCVANESCCYRHDCERLRGCRNEDCINGTCQCSPELVMHNGVCGFLIPCKSFGETCTSRNECCGSSCRDDGFGQLRCLGKSMYQCMADIDCANGPCRGFLCPEALEPYYSLCHP